MPLGMAGCRLPFGRAFTLNVGGLSSLYENRTAFAAVNSLEIAATSCG